MILTWLKCGNGHIFDAKLAKMQALDTTVPKVVVACPTCDTTVVGTVPEAVTQAIARKFDYLQLTTAIMRELGYDNMNKCYYFTYSNMYHGVEDDGYIHT